MTPTDPRQQAAIDAAIDLISTTANSVAARVCETLAAGAESSGRIAERDLINASQFELRRNMGTFGLMFKGALQQRVGQQMAPRADPHRAAAATDWQTLSLVDDHEVEERLFADRIGQTIAHECDAELRELAPYMASLLNTGRADPERNPLRADVLGAALYRAIEAVSEQNDSRKLLARELGQAMARSMPACYAQIVRSLQAGGIEPLTLTVHGVDGPGHHLSGLNSAYAGLDSTRTRSGGELADEHGATTPTGGSSGRGEQRGSREQARDPARDHTRDHTRHDTRYDTRNDPGPRSGRSGGVASSSSPSDAQLMALLRRLSAISSRSGELDPPQRPSRPGGAPGANDGSTETASASPDEETLPGLMAANLIRAHRAELLQASTGQLDHMVIDVVGSLFDQILSDSRVPPQMARQIARLQLPVLRVALHDPSFFSSRRHPVRRFVNRIASLACAYDDFDAGPGRQLLARVGELVQEIVDGDFDQIGVYAAKLSELELFTSEQSRGEIQQTGTATTLDTKESELRIQQRYMMQLQAALGAVPLPPYLRDFLPQVWSQALVLAVRRDGPVSDRAQRYRRVGSELVMSVQPKGSPMLRKKFLMQLPPLMKDLNEGMRLIGWPEPAQRDFFAKLLPAHAESLKGQPLSELDYNMMAKRLEAIFNVPVPGVESLSPADPVPAVEEALIAQRFSPEEVERVGFLEEAAVDWSGTVDIEVGDAAPADATDPMPLDLGVDIELDMGGADPAEPSRGPQLMDHIQLGFAYKMHLKDAWHKVRLAHVSAARTFFVFTRGERHQQLISMTSRMVARMCETGRLSAVESAYLMERATQRARKQLAALKMPPRH